MNLFEERDLAVSTLCQWSCISRSNYYYTPGEKPVGRKPSTHTMRHDGMLVSNETVVAEIKQKLGVEFMDSYGYEYMCVELQKQFVINHKKVYRLMNENNLLLSKAIKCAGARQFARVRTIESTYAMEYLSMDIKYVWTEGEKRNHYLLTIIDVFSKRVVESVLKKSIRKHDVIQMLKRIDLRNGIKGVTIRNDNGPQFIANLVKNFLRTAEVRQEFSHPATPEDNSYIEAFHSILQRMVIDKYEFESYYEASCTIERFIAFYNNDRPHRSIGYITPEQKWQQGLALRADVKQQNVGGTLSRPAPEVPLATSLDNFQVEYLCLTADINACAENIATFNLSNPAKTVQEYGG